jgi:hypothetical protein
VIIGLKGSSLKETRWTEYLVRFVAGGLVTAAAHVVVREAGPVIGGLFLAFPSIFPATATLVSRHERKKKERLGQQGRRRGIEAAALEADGATLGAVGLAAFGAVVWLLDAPLALATAAWFAVSGLLWLVRR